MYLFSRQGRISGGGMTNAMAWVLGITEKVNQIVEFPVTPYSVVFGPGVGTIAWSAVLPDLAALETATDKLIADTGYLELVDQGQQFLLGGADDAVVQIISGQPDPSRDITYATVVTAIVTDGNFARGMEVGVEIAERASKIVGVPTLFGAPIAGNYGAVGWINGFTSVQEMEAANNALAADADFVKYLDKQVGVFASDLGATQQTIYRKLG